MPEPRNAGPSLAMVALILSLALNLFVVAGFVWTRWHGPPPWPHGMGGRPEEMLTERLHLSPDQMPVFEDFKRDLRRDQNTLATGNRPLLKDAWDELQQDKPDAQKVEGLLNQVEANYHTFHGVVSGTIAHFMAALNPEQRAALAHAVLDRHDPAGALIRNVGN